LDRLKLLVPLVLLLIPGVILVGLAQDQLTIDASKQPSPPARGRGPFSPSVGPGHSTYLPIRLELRIQSGPLQPDGTALIDFVITNTGEGDDVILLPSSIKESDGPSSYVLNLWFTSDAVKDAYFKDTASGRPVKIEIVSLSAQLFGRSNEPHSFLPGCCEPEHESACLFSRAIAARKTHSHRSRRTSAPCGARFLDFVGSCGHRRFGNYHSDDLSDRTYSPINAGHVQKARIQPAGMQNQSLQCLSK